MDDFTDEYTGDLVELHVKNNNIEKIKWLLENDNDTDRFWHEIWIYSIKYNKVDIINLFSAYPKKLYDFSIVHHHELFALTVKSTKFDDDDLCGMVAELVRSNNYKGLALLYDTQQLDHYQVTCFILENCRYNDLVLDWIRDRECENAIMTVVKNCDVNGMIDLINDGLDINEPHCCILSLCIVFQQTNLINLLINNHVVISHTAGMIATVDGNLKILQVLFDEGLPRETIDRMFIRYIDNGHYDCVHFLVESDDALNIAIGILHSVSHPKIFDLLVAHGADVDQVSLSCIKKVHLEVIKKLYNLGKINAQEILDYGFEHDNRDIMKFAITLGASMSQCPKTVCISNGNINNIDLLLEAEHMHSFLLKISAKIPNYETSKLLLERGAPISDDAIKNCIEGNDTELFRLFLKYDADIDKNGTNNLLRAVKAGNVVAVKTLLDRGADRGDNERLLHICRKLGYSELITLLET